MAGYAYVPYSSLESVIEHNKEGYYLALRQTQGTIRTDAPDWQPWLLFFARALQQPKRRLEAKVEREHRALANLSPLALHILDCARAGRRNRDVSEGTGHEPQPKRPSFAPRQFPWKRQEDAAERSLTPLALTVSIGGSPSQPKHRREHQR